MAEWKEGDEVMLKSSGPRMTVATIKSDGMVICEWFDGNTPRSHAFNAAVLKRVSDSGPGGTISRG